MPFKGWEPDRKRWTRMYRGKRFRRTPEQLGLPPEDWTAKRSYSAFLAWFREAVQEFEKTGVVPPPDEWKTAPPPIFEDTDENWKDDDWKRGVL